ncbi:MmpS family transport accessory protein [Streptomyces sp. NPDC093681]|uniref:MmpS family transport accessory protein n=1 Tax=Streptomyces sp. NPDC093681 TaxID=3155202 RepID=UPI0034227395
MSGRGRAGVLIAAVLLLACAGLVGYGLLDDTEDEPKQSTTPTAAVTYEVTGDGAAEISYLGPDEDGRATVVRDAELPWKHTVQVPLGETPTVAVVLGEDGGAGRLHPRDPRQARATRHGHGRVRARHLHG